MSSKLLARLFSHANWLAKRGGEFVDAITKCIGRYLADERVRKQQENGARGPHLAYIMGYHRPCNSVCLK